MCHCPYSLFNVVSPEVSSQSIPNKKTIQVAVALLEPPHQFSRNPKFYSVCGITSLFLGAALSCFCCSVFTSPGLNPAFYILISSINLGISQDRQCPTRYSSGSYENLLCRVSYQEELPLNPRQIDVQSTSKGNSSLCRTMMYNESIFIF